METHDIRDDGMIAVKIGEVRQELDLWKVNNEINDLLKKNGSGNDLFAAVVDYLEQLGFPRVSYKAANQFVKLVFGQVKAEGNG